MDHIRGYSEQQTKQKLERIYLIKEYDFIFEFDNYVDDLEIQLQQKANEASECSNECIWCQAMSEIHVLPHSRGRNSELR